MYISTNVQTVSKLGEIVSFGCFFMYEKVGSNLSAREQPNSARSTVIICLKIFLSYNGTVALTQCLIYFTFGSAVLQGGRTEDFAPFLSPESG